MNDAPKTMMSKGRDGWDAKTKITLGLCPSFDLASNGKTDSERVLTIHTFKGSRGLGTYASVSTSHKDGFTTMILGSDFYERIATSSERCTEASVKRLHATALQDLGNIVMRARSFYERKDALAKEKADQKAEAAHA